ncbi:MAG TPA: DEAD/DEAH box helicase [Ilumatobacter sp.]|nr:DEAD/DEAH box helicase [Ilumatobacter sp.]
MPTTAAESIDDTTDRTVRDGIDPDLVADVARWFVRAGRVVPGLTVDADGRPRSWWWPLPAVTDRALLATLIGPANDIESHRAAAAALADEVDRQVRARLAGAGVDLVGRVPGRRAVPEVWLRSLSDPDPWLPPSADIGKARALTGEVAEWVSEAVAGIGSVGVRLRIVEPGEPGAPEHAWSVEALAFDVDEPSLVSPVGAALGPASPFAADAAETILTALGRAVRVAPELAGVLDRADAGPVAIGDAELVTLLAERTGPLADVGVAVLVPSWWTNRRQLGVRAKATQTAGSVTSAGFGFDDVVAFRWEAVLGDQRLTKADLAALQRAAAAKRSLVRIRGQWVELDPAELEALLRAAGTPGEATVGDLVRTGFGLPSVAAPGGVRVVGAQATGRLGELLAGTLHERAEPVAAPDGFAGVLRDYQARGVGWLRLLGLLGLGACLADDMGLGKTAQLIATVLADPVPEPTLVVCPTSVLGNWEREVARFAPGLRVYLHHGAGRQRTAAKLKKACRTHDVVLTSYGLLARDADLLEGVTWGRVALDEAQQVKNPYTAAAKAVQRLPAKRRIALTGTPVENRLTELWAIMQAVNPGLLGSLNSFKQRFAAPIERDGDDAAAARLQRLTAPFVLRRVKTDKRIIDDLPDKVEVTERCPLTREQASLYQAVVDDLLERAEQAEGIERSGLVLAGIMKLKQVCNHPAHFAKDRSALHGRSGKLTRAEELFEELLAAGDKALVFTQFTEWGELLVPYLGRRYGVPVLWLHGATPRRRRDALVAEFQERDGPALFLLSLKAGGTGLNLTAASHVVHLDRWWNPAVEDQATDRAFRIGQHRNVLVHKLVSTGTVEERIDAMIATKRALASKVVGTAETWITDLSNDELRDLLVYDASGEEG